MDPGARRGRGLRERWPRSRSISRAGSRGRSRSVNTGAQSQFTLVAPCPPDAVSIMGKWVCTEMQNVFDDSTRPISPVEFTSMFRGSERAGLQSIAVLGDGELVGVILARQLPLGVVEAGWLAPQSNSDRMLPA